MSTIPARIALRCCAHILRGCNDVDGAAALTQLIKKVPAAATLEPDLVGYLVVWADGYCQSLDEIRYLTEIAEHRRAAEIADATRADLLKVCAWLVED